MKLPADHPLQDFRNFLFLIWKHLGLPDPTPVQYDIASYLQHGPKRLMVQAFRGVGKSWITSAFVVWLLLVDPDTKVLVVSASKDRSDSFSTFTKRLIGEVPILNHLKPGRDQRDSNISFDVGPARPAHAASVKSVGITGQLTGSRANVIVSDDIEVPNNSLTQLQRDKLAEAVKEYDAILSPDPGARIIYLGTPQTEMSVYHHLPERGYEVRVWPARIPKPEKVIHYKGTLAPYVEALLGKLKPATPLDNRRFTDADLLDREASYGRSGFALQFMLDTTLSDAERYPLKTADFIVFDIDPQVAPTKLVWGSGFERIINDIPNVGMAGDSWNTPMWVSPDFIEYTGSVMFIDPSGRGEDETGWAIVKYLNGMLFLMDAGGLTGGYDENTLEFLATKARDYQVNLVLVESNFGDGMFLKLLTPYLKRIYPVSTEEVRATGQKELRIIYTLEPVLNQHRLIVSRRLIQNDMKREPVHFQLFYQLTRITKDRGALRHDDRLDAVAGAVRYWVDQMGVDVEDAEQDRQQELLDQELEQFMDHVLGREARSREKTWVKHAHDRH